MFAVTVGVSILLATLLAVAAIRKLSHRPAVVETYLRVGVPEDRLDQLAVILLSGAAGLLVGLVWAPIGVAAAIGVVIYFLVAIAFHVRADDAEHAPTPVIIWLLAAAALGLQIARL
jgi:DoxX-like family